MGEGERPATLIEQFLDQIKDPKYDITVTTLRMDNNKTLESCIEAVRRHDLVLARQRIQDHRLLKVRRMAGMEDVSDEGAVTNVQSSSYIAPEIWKALTPDQRKAIIQARQKDGGKAKSESSPNPMSKREKNRAQRARVKAKRDAKKKKESQKDGEDSD